MTTAAIEILRNTVQALREENAKQLTDPKMDECDFQSNRRAIRDISLLIIEDEFEKKPVR